MLDTMAAGSVPTYLLMTLKSITFLMLFQVIVCVQVDEVTYYQFEEVGQRNLQHMALDGATGNIYVGSVNRLYKLSSDLAVEQVDITGPVDDNILCPPPSVPTGCPEPKISTDNINKILVVNRERNELITCGSVYQGICQLHSLDDLTNFWNQSTREVVTNTEQGTNVAFIAPGPSGYGNLLYIVASHGKWTRPVPTIATRRLDMSFSAIGHREIPGNTFDEAVTKGANDFDINYMYGFSSGGFRYFIATQLENFREAGSPLYTKIVRLCQQDDSEMLYSYIELPLHCHLNSISGVPAYKLSQSAYVSQVGSDLHDAGIKQGDDVLFVTFSSEDTDSEQSGIKSVICMYSMTQINKKFLERITQCANQGTDNTETDWLGTTACSIAPFVVAGVNASGVNYCHISDVNSPLGGLQLPIQATSIYSSTSSITAIISTPHNEATVLFLGDDQGKLIKLHVKSLSKTDLYEELSIVSGSPVVQNGLMYDSNKEYVYVMTERKITKVPVETCEMRTSCEECLMTVAGETNDPHCGWCPLQTSCTRRTEGECTGSSGPLANRWIDHRDGCTKIQSVTPASIPSDSRSQLTLSVRSLPEMSSGLYYECIFGDLGSTPVEVTHFSAINNGNSTIQCASPSREPVLQGGNLQVPLSIRANVTGKLIVSTTFDFYNCSAFDSCSKCVEDYLCNWCVYENRCTGNTSTCNASGIVTGQMVQDVQTTKRGKDFCPRISNNAEILIPAGDLDPFSFTVDVHSLPVQVGYQCVLVHENWRESLVTPAVMINGTTIRCTDRKYNYSMNENTVHVSFFIRWNNGLFNLDDPSDIQVTLFKCSVKRTDCGKCLTSDAKYHCGWCEQDSACTMMRQCPATQSQLPGQRWLSNEGLCPDPKITSFWPKSGHIAGGTNVTIEGVNLGQDISHIRAVTVASMPCMLISSLYEKAARIVCSLMASPEPTSGPVKVMIGRDNATTRTMSQDFFSFVVPSITSFNPDLGPKSGGTRVTLFGEHLNAGVTQSIEVAGEPCNILETPNSPNNVSCMTSSIMYEEKGPIVMTFDLMGTATSKRNYTYTRDPTISDLSRTSTIMSGGLDLPVMGEDLDVIQEPRMAFDISAIPSGSRTKRQASQPVTTVCQTTSATAMICKSPDLSIPEIMNILVFNNSTTTPSFVLPKDRISFVMDAVPGLVSKSDMTVYIDPVYFKFEEEGNLKQIEFGERRVLEIKGQYIAQTYMMGDVTVRVGPADCESVMMTREDVLTCQAPQNDVGQTYDVVVHHGNLRALVGRLEYLPEQLPLTTIIGVACGCALALLALLLILCIWRRISKNERRFKKMELQRDEMEMRVAQECKDAFAELQITVLTVSSDVEGSGIPFRDYRDYVARVLFPENPSHPVFRENSVVKENIQGVKRDILQKGLVQFGNLISNHTFLSIFIRTLESQKTLTLKDLSNIASLLMIALHNKMDFLTEAMKSLLQIQIKRYVMQGQPQLLLRRSEAVVEKLVSHWISLLMYDSLKESMGKPLFHLFYAIKQQIDKGPVDAVTGEARYGLSEMKVIRQQIDFKTLNIFTNTLDKLSEPIQLKVLDCDTISQTKDKILDAIFKSCPFSKRPMREELDLEWTDGPQGNLILLDDDGRARLDGEWKRINTLAYYHIPDGATLRLVRAQPNGGSLPNSPAKKYGMGTLQTSPATSASPIIDQERGTIYWHLVKHVDSGSLRKGERDQKMMAEIYLPRLLTTKGILQTFVDELLETIFNFDKYDSEVPPLTVKYLFDFMDQQSASLSISNTDVVHTWKSNALQLRFWVNLIMNPTILFDINKTDTVDACVSIIGQTLIDSCSVAEQYLTKDSPSNKLLYAKDIPTYKQWVARYYKDISEMPAISDQDMSAMLAAHTNRYQNAFQPLNALNELYFCYACSYKSEILQALDEDKEALEQSLGDKLEDIFRLMADSA